MTKDEIVKLSDKELRIKAAEIVGWEFDVYVKSDNSYEDSFHTIAPDGMIRDLVPDYPNDLKAAMGLWSQIPGIKEIWWNDEGKIYIQLSWSKCENTWPPRPSDQEYAYWVEGKPEELPRLLTQAFVIYKEKK